MPDTSEIAAVKASFRGAPKAAKSLEALRDRIDALDPRAEIAPTDPAEH